MPKLLAGPWLGEFGWELFAWQGMLRHMVAHGNFDHVTVASRPGHDVLYRDFAHTFIPIAAEGQTDGWRLNGATPAFAGEILRDHADEDTTVARPGPYPHAAQQFICYGSFRGECRYDVVIHARSTTKCGTAYRNWPVANWEEFTSRLHGHTLAFIGSAHGSAYVDMPHTVDLRGVHLEELADVFSSSRLAVGPSSGPLHLASLCRCPHLVWTDRSVWGTVGGTNRARYEQLWNAFHTPVRVVDAYGWEPPAAYIAEEVEAFLQGGTFSCPGYKDTSLEQKP